MYDLIKNSSHRYRYRTDTDTDVDIYSETATNTDAYTFQKQIHDYTDSHNIQKQNRYKHIFRNRYRCRP